MYLSHVEIKNFRLFRELDLELNRGLNVLVGENDSGKTSLIDAIRYALGMNSNDWTYVAESDFFDNSDELSIGLKFSEVDAHAHRFVEHLSHEEYTAADGARKRRSVLYVQLRAQKTGIERRGYPYIRTEVRSGADGNGPLLEADIRSFLATTYLKPLRDAEAELSAGRASRLSQILSSSKDIREGVDEILTIIANANQSLLAEDAALKKSAANIREDYLHKLVFERDKDTLGVFIDIAGIKRDELDGLQETEKRRHLRAVLEGLSLTLTDDRRLHGLGYHNLLFMAAELLLLEQEAAKEFPLLLVEEPEAHLHPQLQMKLLQFINSKAKTEANPDGVQCILTTHSPNISSKADPSEIIFFNGGSAWPFRSGETELAEDDYVYLRKFLDVTKANVFFAKGLLFVEGEAENILLPEVASLLGRPLESYGVSVVKYDNSGSWKRFAKLFLRNGKDEDAIAWVPTKVCVLRDLDLRPLCAEEKDDGTNPYGFLVRKEPGTDGRGGNLAYWEHADEEERQGQIEARKAEHKRETSDGASLERQCNKVFVSDRWTFEFCLARYGLFDECCVALGLDADVPGNADERATYLQSKARKSDLAYVLAETLREQCVAAREAAIADLTPEQRQDEALCDGIARNAMEEFSSSLKRRLPPTSSKRSSMSRPRYPEQRANRKWGMQMPDPLSSPTTREDIAALARNERLHLDDDSRIGVLLSGTSIDVQACPGSGKTTLIAAKLMLLAKKWAVSGEGICVLSRTNVAKNEIVQRLSVSRTLAARRLVSYPHLIGTIQEFVNRFLALPYLRSTGISDVTVDNDEYVAAARRLLGRNQFAWLRGTLNGLGSVENQDGFLRETHWTCAPNGAANINISRRPRAWQQPQKFQRAHTDLLRLKGYLAERGYFLFRDMYTYAQLAVASNGSLPKILATRFPYLFVDEMQDTQRFQDEILRMLFPLNDATSIVQRFGDPDQAIFHGLGNAEPNETFNGKAAEDMDFVIHRSHRFDNEISERIKGLSYNEVPLDSELNEAALGERGALCAIGQKFEHTVLVFNDDTRGNIIDLFAQVVSRQFEVRHKQSPQFCAKAVGAVGNEIDPNQDQLKIGHYWPAYNKGNAATSFKPRTLIEAVRYCRRSASVDWAENYRTLMDCLLKLLRLAGQADDDGRNLSARSLRTRFEADGEWQNLREAIRVMLDDSYVVEQEFWTDVTALLLAIFDIVDMPEGAREYLAFSEDESGTAALEEMDGDPTVLTAMPGNTIRHEDGFLIELSTIHGVKGETHDATLVLETKNYCFDLGVMVPYLAGECPSDAQPNSRIGENARSRRANKQFMRQLYVAMSRPRHLLCLALHSDRLSADRERLLRDKGWTVLRLSSDSQENEVSFEM